MIKNIYWKLIKIYRNGISVPKQHTEQNNVFNKFGQFKIICHYFKRFASKQGAAEKDWRNDSGAIYWWRSKRKWRNRRRRNFKSSKRSRMGSGRNFGWKSNPSIFLKFNQNCFYWFYYFKNGPEVRGKYCFANLTK